LKESSKKIVLGIAIIIISMFVLNETIFSIYNSVTPKPLTSQTEIGRVNAGSYGRFTFSCPQQSAFGFLDFCSIRWDPYGDERITAGKYKTICIVEHTTYDCGGCDWCSGGVKNIDIVGMMQEFSLHYCGNGICETNEPYSEYCENCQEDCGPCPTTTTTTIPSCVGFFCNQSNIVMALIGGLSIGLVGLIIYKKRK